MKKIFILLSLFFASHYAQAAVNCAIAPGSSGTTIQTALNNAAANNCIAQTIAGVPIDGRTAFFQAGVDTASQQFTIPCSTSSGAPIIVEGVPFDTTQQVYNYAPTSTINSALGTNWVFALPACTIGPEIRYLEINGNEPTGGGGGSIYVTPGANNATIHFNYLHGNQGIQVQSHPSDTLIWLDGSDVSGSTRTQNLTVDKNKIGNPNSNDCSNLMNVIGGPDKTTAPYGKCVPVTTYTFTQNNITFHVPGGYNGGGTGNAAVCIYQDSDNEKNTGGYCAGVGVHVKTDNLIISNNLIAHVEQGIKLFEGCGSNTCPAQFDPTNMLINANDFTQMHRITLEGQQTPKGSPGVVVSNNSQHDQILFGGVSWGLSLPQGSATVVTPTGPTIHSNNLLIENNLKGVDKNGYGASRSYCDEFWGNGSIYNNNLCQGYWGGGTAWGFGAVPWAINNNTYQQATNYFENYISQEEGQTNGPTQTGNVTTHTISTITSITPTISPSSGTAPLTVTLTDAGYTSGSLPLGHTSIWYTTDGSTPVPGTGTTKRVDSGGTVLVSSAITLKAVGMWGGIAQPASYPSGYGFTPSAMVSGNFTGGGPPPTLQTITLSSTGGITTFPSGATNQLIATGHYSDSSTQNISSTASFTSSNTAVGTVTSPGGFYTAGGTASTTNINASLGAISTTTPLVLTTTVAQPTITGGFLSNTGSVNTIAIGTGTIQFVANANYTDGQTRTLPDIYGNYPATWSITPNSSVCGTISPYVSNANPGGLFTPTAVGTCNVFVKTNTGSIFSSWGMTVTAAAPTLQSITLTATGGATSITTGSTLQLIATGNYSDGSHQTLTSLVNSWASSDNTKATISSTGSVIGVAAGTPTFTATYQSVISTPALPITITSSIVLQSVTISNSLGTNVFAQGWTVPWKGMCGYSNGDLFDCTNTDGHGNQVIFSSSNTAKVSFNSNISSAVAQGTSTVTATAASVPSMPAVVTVTVAPTQVFSITGGTVTITGNQMVFSGVGSGTVTPPPPPPPSFNTYFLSPSGNDNNNGTSTSTPWLSPNHSINCGDQIIASAGNYVATNFQSFGTVTCTAGNNVAWLKCATFDTCKISTTADVNGMTVNHSYWGVTGWEVSTSGQNWTTCFNANPPNSSTIIHHIIFANNIANGCQGGGFSFYNNGIAGSEDYLVLVGNIAYNAAQGSLNCFSGISIFEPLNSDTIAGTHLYVAGNFSYHNFNPATCAGTAPTDGEGIIIDTPDQRDNSGGAVYTQQIVVQNNIAVGNGGRGILIANNSMGSAHAPIQVLHNTNYGNNQSATGASFTCGFQGEIGETSAFNTTATVNLNMTSAATGCSGAAIWGFSMSGGNGTDIVSGNWLYSAAGNTTFLSSSAGFSYGSNTTGTNPAFTSTSIPSAPSCSGTANTSICMATLINNFIPTNVGAKSFGYQIPSNTCVSDPLYPQWLKNVNLPAGLVTPGC